MNNGRVRNNSSMDVYHQRPDSPVQELDICLMLVGMARGGGRSNGSVHSESHSITTVGAVPSLTCPKRVAVHKQVQLVRHVHDRRGLGCIGWVWHDAGLADPNALCAHSSRRCFE